MREGEKGHAELAAPEKSQPDRDGVYRILGGMFNCFANDLQPLVPSSDLPVHSGDHQDQENQSCMYSGATASLCDDLKIKRTKTPVRRIPNELC
jgi:hypothetical protein